MSVSIAVGFYNKAQIKNRISEKVELRFFYYVVTTMS